MQPVSSIALVRHFRVGGGRGQWAGELFTKVKMKHFSPRLVIALKTEHLGPNLSIWLPE